MKTFRARVSRNGRETCAKVAQATPTINPGEWTGIAILRGQAVPVVGLSAQPGRPPLVFFVSA